MDILNNYIDRYLKAFDKYITNSGSPLMDSAVIIVAFVIGAKVVDFVVDKILRKLASMSDFDLDDKVIDTIHRPVILSTILAGIHFASKPLELGESASFILNGAVSTLVALIWTMTMLKITSIVVEGMASKRTDETGLAKDILPLVGNTVKVGIIIGFATVTFSIWHVNLAPLLASAGIVGAGVAIAAKDTISNLFGGLSIFMDRPFKVGDYIIIDRQERGEVVTIGLRSTRILTRDHVQVILPNSIIANSKIINESAPEPNFRVRVPVTAAYGSDVAHVERVLLDVAKANENVIPEPAPRVRFRKFGDSALEFELLCWLKEPSLKGLALHQMNSSIYNAFASEGITIPFPQRDVHIYQADKTQG